MMTRNPGHFYFALVAMLAGFAGHSQPASAQLLWDWGGKEEVDGSGREVVRFNPQYTRARSSSASATAGCTS